MPDQERLSYAPAGPGTAQPCWLCGIRLPADHMVADGGSACADVRWYCLDMQGCTERWTARSPRPGDVPDEQRRDAGLLGTLSSEPDGAGGHGATAAPGLAAGR